MALSAWHLLTILLCLTKPQNSFCNWAKKQTMSMTVRTHNAVNECGVSL